MCAVKTARAPAAPSQARHHGHTRAWLSASGSLTARLRRLGAVRVQVLRQGHQRLWAWESAALGGQTHGHVREVLLWVDGRAAVWARSCTSAVDARGPWRAIKGLGSRPLAEILFTDGDIQRGALDGERWPAHGRAWSHRRRAWLHVTVNQPAPVWARHSVFRRRGAPLLVTECFAPWVTQQRP